MNVFKKKRGEGYVDVCVGVIAFVMLIVIAINIFSFIDLRLKLDRISDELIDTAAFNGCYDDEFQGLVGELRQHYGMRFKVNSEADSYFNAVYRRVQLGHRMTVTVSYDTEIKGLGVFSIPVTVSVTRSGLSQQYWK